MKRLLIVTMLAAPAVIDCDITAHAQPHHEQLQAHAVLGWRGRQDVEYERTGPCEYPYDGYYFVDIATGKLVRVSGTVAIEQLP